jgi:hypothetical protein
MSFDLTVQDDLGSAVNDGLMTTAPIATGETVSFEIYLADAAGKLTIGFDLRFDNTGNQFTDNFALSGYDFRGATSAFNVNAAGDVASALVVPPFTGTAVPATNLLGVVTLTAKQDIAEGTTVSMLATTAVADAAAGVSDPVNLDNATITFQTPAGPALGANPAIATIPRGGSVTSVVTLSNVTAGDAIDWTVTKDSGAATVAVQGQSSLSFSTTATGTSETITAAGTSDSVLPYSFVDQAPPQAEIAFYRLDQLDLDGTIHSSNVIEVILGARFMDLPTEFSTNVYPNPFNPSTTVSYDLPSEAAVSIVIYDALGQEVRRLVSEQKAAGRYTVQWDARDNLGRSVGSGVYIAKVEAGSYSSSQKMLLLK